MKNKLLIVLFFSVIMCLIIYLMFRQNIYYYLALGEIPRDHYRYEYQDYVREYLDKQYPSFKFNKNFLREDYTTETFLKLINNAATSVNNGEIETITKAINNSSFITLNLGCNEIESIITQNYDDIDSKKVYMKIDEMIDNYDEILRKIRFLSDSPIILIGYFNPFSDYSKKDIIDKVYLYAESRLNELIYFEKIYIVNLAEKFAYDNTYIEKLERFSPSIKGYKYISDKIIEIYENINLN